MNSGPDHRLSHRTDRTRVPEQTRDWDLGQIRDSVLGQNRPKLGFIEERRHHRINQETRS